MIATLKGDMAREKAEIGLFITLNPPTRPMIQEATGAGIYSAGTVSGSSLSAGADSDGRGSAVGCGG